MTPVDDVPPAPFPTYESSSPAPISFPPPPNPGAPPSSGSPSSLGARTNPLSRALNAASKKLWGAPSSPRTSGQYAPRQQILSSRGGLGLDVDGRHDPEEDALLESLEKLAQKTEVLANWGDEMFEYVKNFPQSKPCPFVLLL